jgi:hypothetical protein
VAQRQHGLTRILILDWDIHHGNGTQVGPQLKLNGPFSFIHWIRFKEVKVIWRIHACLCAGMQEVFYGDRGVLVVSIHRQKYKVGELMGRGDARSVPPSNWGPYITIERDLTIYYICIYPSR